MSAASPRFVASYLKNEYPQTVAVVLTRLDTAFASKVLESLPENFGMEVVMRMMRMEPVSLRVLEIVEREMRRDLTSKPSLGTEPLDLLSELIGGMGDERRRLYMSALEERNREAHAQISKRMAPHA